MKTKFVVGGLFLALLSGVLFAGPFVKIVQYPPAKQKQHSDDYPPHKFLLKAPKGWDLWLVSQTADSDTPSTTPDIDSTLSDDKLSVFKLVRSTAPAPARIQGQIAPRKISESGEPIEMPYREVPMDAVRNEDNSIIAINNHMASDMDDVDLVLQDGRYVYFVAMLKMWIDEQLTQSKIEPEPGLDHSYLIVTKAKGRRLKCNLSGHHSGPDRYSLDKYFWVEVNTHQNRVLFKITGTASPTKNDRNGPIGVSPITNKVIW